MQLLCSMGIAHARLPFESAADSRVYLWGRFSLPTNQNRPADIPPLPACTVVIQHLVRLLTKATR
jgi:hypothetical protein